eukprot:tig00020824_g14271.t1
MARSRRSPSWAPLFVVVLTIILLVACAEAAQKRKSTATGRRSSSRLQAPANDSAEEEQPAPPPTRSRKGKEKAVSPDPDQQQSDPEDEPEDDVAVRLAQREQFGGAYDEEEQVAARNFPNLAQVDPGAAGPSTGFTRHLQGPYAVPAGNSTAPTSTKPAAGALPPAWAELLQRGIDSAVIKLQEQQQQQLGEQQKDNHEAMQLKNPWLRELALQLSQLKFQLKRCSSCTACYDHVKQSLKILDELRKRIDIRDKGGDKLAERLSGVPEEYRGTAAALAHALNIAGPEAAGGRPYVQHANPRPQHQGRDRPPSQRNSGMCFRCNKPGHVVKDCPNEPRPGWRDPPSRP